MARSSNLDNVAPDNHDIIPSNSVSDPSPSLPPLPPKKKIKKTPLPPLTSAASELRQKIYQTLGHTKTPFSSFLVKPKVFSFRERDEEEEIILVLRQHWFTNVSWILTSLLMIFAPILIRFIPIISDLTASFNFIFVLFWYLITFAYTYERFLSWYFNVFIITDERVVDIDFNNLLNKRYSEAKISVIQDVTSQVSGVAQTMFNYGTVFIQTAAEVPEIIFERVPSPEKVIKALQQLRQEEEQEMLEGRVR